MIVAEYGGANDRFGRLGPIAVVGLPDALRQRLHPTREDQ
ncbi:MAG: hypothetical protein JWN51_685 [Phycisphaerales bacterium]|nr:hypothetical protein [Phycisphaerales bacterium]